MTSPRDHPARWRWRVLPLVVGTASVAGALVALEPLIESLLAARDARRALAAARRAVESTGDGAPRRVRSSSHDRPALRLTASASGLASWANVGGCGVGGAGANATGGGVRWIGRSVTGGLVQLQCIASSTILGGAYFNTLNTRIASGSALFNNWILAANIPVVLKIKDVEVRGVDQTAMPSGFGDISLQVTRKLGLTNTNFLSLIVSIPTGAYDAVREGIVLPQPMQLGAGVVSATVQYETIKDVDWGLMILGGTFKMPLQPRKFGDFPGENKIGDYRPPSMSGYVYVGYLLGPFVPSLGWTLSANLGRFRQRFAPLENQPLGVGTLTAAVEWSTDVIAVLLTSATAFYAKGVQSVTFGLGVQSSLF